MALPAQPVTAPPANPYPHGLYAAATVVDEAQARHQGGITLITPNAGPHGQWPVDCPTPDDAPDKVGNRPGPVGFPATAVWAIDECKTVGVTETEAQERATHTLRLSEPLDVEKFAASQLTQVTPKVTATGIKAALEQLEDHLTQHGYTGVIHARRGLIAHLTGMIVRQGGQLLTPGGHKWAFGAGYGALGDTLVGTGPVTIRRGPVVTGMSVDKTNNIRLALAERVVAVGWEPPTLAVTLSRSGPHQTLPGDDTLPGASTLPTP